MNKKNFIILFISFLFVSTLWAGAHIINFTAESDDSNIIIRWTTSDETNMSYFVVERKSVNGNFAAVSQPIAAKGNNSSYEFIDENAFKSTDFLFVYQLKIVDKDNKISHSGTVSVSHSVSSVRRTWGSIKALFR